MIIKIGSNIVPSQTISTFQKTRNYFKKKICDKNRRFHKKTCPLAKPELVDLKTKVQRQRETATGLICSATKAYDVYDNIRRKTNIGAITRARNTVSLN